VLSRVQAHAALVHAEHTHAHLRLLVLLLLLVMLLLVVGVLVRVVPLLLLVVLRRLHLRRCPKDCIIWSGCCMAALRALRGSWREARGRAVETGRD